MKFRAFLGLCAAVCLCYFSTFAVGKEIDARFAKPSADGQTLWYDGRLLALEGKGWSETATLYSRLPAKAQSKVTTAVWGLATNSAGLAMRFSTTASNIEVRWTVISSNLAMPHMPATGVSGLDLYSQDKSGQWRFVANGRPTGVENTCRFGLPAGQTCLLYLPLYNGLKSIEIGLPKGASLASPDGVPPKPLVFYGTSITQGGCASRPGLAYPSIIGRRLNVPVVNLGFSGSGTMEPEMAQLLAEIDASAYVLDCLWNMSQEMIAARVEPFVRKLRAARPNTPIWLAEDCNFYNVSPTAKGDLVRRVHEKLTAEGMKNLFFIANAGMLGDDSEGTVDGCHPNDLGMMRQADVFLKALQRGR